MVTKITTEAFISRAKKVHRDRYDYSKTKYTDSSTKLTVLCKKHGSFDQLPHNHLNSNGCPKCGRITAVSKYKKYSLEDIQQVALKCTSRGEFRTSYPEAYNAAHNQNVYQEVCKHMPDEYNKPKTTEKFKSQVYDLEGFNYIVTGSYVNRQTPIDILHETCGHTYTVRPGDFINGRRCPFCAQYGFNFLKPAILYYLILDVEGVLFYKVGVTNNSVEARYSKAEQSVIKEKIIVEFVTGKEAYKIEQLILKEFKDYRYKGAPILATGNTEILTTDIRNDHAFTDVIQKYETEQNTNL